MLIERSVVGRRRLGLKIVTGGQSAARPRSTWPLLSTSPAPRTRITITTLTNSITDMMTPCIIYMATAHYPIITKEAEAHPPCSPHYIHDHLFSKLITCLLIAWAQASFLRFSFVLVVSRSCFLRLTDPSLFTLCLFTSL